MAIEAVNIPRASLGERGHPTLIIYALTGVASTAALTVVAPAPDGEPAVHRGNVVFDRNCVACHGRS